LQFVAKLTNKIRKEFKIRNDNIKFELNPCKKVFSIFTNTKSKIPHFRKSYTKFDVNTIGETYQTDTETYQKQH
jgi:hypothetical protein